MSRQVKRWAIVAAVFVFVGSSTVSWADPLPPLRRVNAPYFANGVIFSQSAVFWFGQVTPNKNYADVRVGYDDNKLFVHVAIFDRLLWYNAHPATDALTNWDSVTLYLNETGADGTTLEHAYRFDGQVNWWEPRAAWQAEYKGSSTGWVAATTAFTTETSFRYETDTVGGFNNNENNRGWTISFTLPYASLGLTARPAAGTVWGLAVAVHDRDYAPPAAMQPDELWPEAANPATPATWGQLYFGQPVFTPQPASPAGTVTIRNGVNAVVSEAAAGGGTLCGYPLDDYWNVWGQRVMSDTYAFNVQNQYNIADWPCFSKYYTTFPLDRVPPDKVVISATLAMNQFGNAGEGWTPPPAPSYIQVLTVGQDWTPGALNWNNAPLARENVAMTEVDPLNGGPAVFRTWDVTRAVAEAYRAGQPLRLAVYSADWDYHSGRYFRPSSYPDPEFRPLLTVQWGDPLAAIHKSVWPLYPSAGQPVSYTLQFLGDGRALTLTDSLPPQLGEPGTISVAGGGAPAYDSGAHEITWMGTPSVGQAVTLTFPVTSVVSGPTLIRNTAVLTDAVGHVSTDTAVLIVDPYLVWLPSVRR